MRARGSNGYPAGLPCSWMVAAIALAGVACGDDTSAPLPGPPIEGRVVPVDGGALTGLTVSWRTEETPGGASAAVGEDGTFSIQPADAAETGEILVDGPAPRAFHPFLFPFHRDSVSQSDLLLIPTSWTIQDGEFAGRTVATSLDLAMEDDAGSFLYSYFWAQPEPFDQPNRYRVELITWPEDAFPLSVAFDHANSTTALTPSDSAAVWGVLDRMEVRFGRDLFQPVVADPGWWTEPWRDDPQPVPGVVRVVHDPPAWFGPSYASDPADEWAVELGPWAQGGRFSAFEVTRQFLNAGTLVVGEFEDLRLADGFIPWETVLTHEMLHVLGAGHTCRIPSPQGPCARTADVSEQDVAYLELLRRTLTLEEELGSNLSVIPATIGERVIMMGASTLPPLDPRPLSSGMEGFPPH